VFDIGSFFVPTPHFFQKNLFEVLTVSKNLIKSWRMENPSVKKGRGRPVGATSTIEITLGELLAKLNNDANATVTVGRVWYNKYQNVPVASVQDGDSLPQEIQNQLDEEPVAEFTITQ
jgi:hypothetical protein